MVGKMNYRIVYSNELYHFGVKGMKWGVRRKEKAQERKERRELRKLEKLKKVISKRTKTLERLLTKYLRST